MGKSKWLSDDRRMYYRYDLAKLLLAIDVIAQPTLTFYKVSTCFNGDNGVILRKCLRTLEHDGCIVNVKGGWNFDKWMLSEKGESLKKKHIPFSYYSFGEFKQ